MAPEAFSTGQRSLRYRYASMTRQRLPCAIDHRSVWLCRQPSPRRWGSCQVISVIGENFFQLSGCRLLGSNRVDRWHNIRATGRGLQFPNGAGPHNLNHRDCIWIESDCSFNIHDRLQRQSILWRSHRSPRPARRDPPAPIDVHLGSRWPRSHTRWNALKVK